MTSKIGARKLSVPLFLGFWTLALSDLPVAAELRIGTSSFAGSLHHPAAGTRNGKPGSVWHRREYVGLFRGSCRKTREPHI